ncbi:MAG: DHH family phosphoesterase [Candidatus Aenigmarchaeota archaeon]|nr:DHH family phosphoesterase [Candidatus Aenigmarchaeota archaeon]
MKEKLEMLIKTAKTAADRILEHKGEIRVLSHYDADGISSAAIFITALIRAGKQFHLTLVKQLSEGILESVSAEKRDFVVFLDMGAGQIDEIKKYLPNAFTVIIDHHQPEGTLEREKMIHVNPMDFSRDEDISGSGVTYIVSRAINNENRNLAGIAIIGAIGDSQTGSIGEKWGLYGLNREILKDAIETRKIRMSKGLRIWGRDSRPLHKALAYSVDPYIPNVSGSESQAMQFLNEIGLTIKKDNDEWRTLSDLNEDEQKKLASGIIAERVNGGQPNAEWIFGDVYDLLDKGSDCKDANEFATLLNACGKMGRAYLGVELCMNVPKAFLEVKWVMEKYRKNVGTAVRWIHEQIEAKNRDVIRKTGNAWYVIAGSRINEHIVSNVISIVEKSMGIGKPVFAFADSEDGVKVSARASDELVGNGLNLKKVCNRAAASVGGQGGGHSGASGAMIPAGTEQAFISAVEDILSQKEKTSEEKEKNIKPNPQPNNSEKDNHYGSTEEKGPEKDRRKEVEGKGLVHYISS